MCTLTIVSIEPGVLRLVFNRDELVSRPPALPPRVSGFGTRRALLPIDPVSGGTWIAATDAGLAFALLNLNQQPADDHWSDDAPGVSRGQVIPALLGSSSLEEALVRAGRTWDRGFRPYRLIITDRRQIAVLTTNGGPPMLERQAVSPTPSLFTSSGLGDHLVEGPRRALFERIVDGSPDPVAAQDRFHRHRWGSMPHVSVRMDRGVARTVSLTVLRMEPDRSRMTYRAIGPQAGAFPRMLATAEAAR